MIGFGPRHVVMTEESPDRMLRRSARIELWRALLPSRTGVANAALSLFCGFLFLPVLLEHRAIVLDGVRTGSAQVSQSFSDKLNSASQNLADLSGKLTLKSSQKNSVEMAEMAKFLKENRIDPSALAIAIRNGKFVRSFTDGKRVTYRVVITPSPTPPARYDYSSYGGFYDDSSYSKT